MDKELVKDIVGRPKWWLVAVPLMVAFIVIATLLLPDDADGAESPAGAARICPAGEWDCHTADRYAEDFRADRFGNSRGVEFSPRIKRMISAEMSARGIAARGGGATLSGSPRASVACDGTDRAAAVRRPSTT